MAPAPPTGSPTSGFGSPADEGPGSYALIIDVEHGCDALPAAATRRSYSARFEDRDSGSFVVSVSGATFLAGLICTGGSSRLGCDQFVGSQAGSAIHFNLLNENDDAHGGHIVEQLPGGTWLEMVGSAAGERRADGTIVATGSASLRYCPLALSYPYPCSTPRGCRSDALRMTFTPR